MDHFYIIERNLVSVHGGSKEGKAEAATSGAVAPGLKSATKVPSMIALELCRTCCGAQRFARETCGAENTPPHNGQAGVGTALLRLRRQSIFA
jgi:hypothetical protein